jgi:D-alanine-D-alanine ligase
VPAPLSEGEVAEVQALAIRTFKALRAEGLARVDFFLSETTGFLVNEVNTMPGFTPISMYPMLWAASGLDYAPLIDELVSLAIARQQRRSNFATSH